MTRRLAAFGTIAGSVGCTLKGTKTEERRLDLCLQVHSATAIDLRAANRAGHGSTVVGQRTQESPGVDEPNR